MSKVESGGISSAENVRSSDFNVTSSDLSSTHR